GGGAQAALLRSGTPHSRVHCRAPRQGRLPVLAGFRPAARELEIQAAADPPACEGDRRMTLSLPLPPSLLAQAAPVKEQPKVVHKLYCGDERHRTIEDCLA